MKRFIGKQKAFSLAEALITLLIVCLIAIATIPILTKKKRALSTGHGTYICTLNSNHDYVEYSSETDTADKDNPDTWRLAANNGHQDVANYIGEDGLPKNKVRNQCKFRPPSGARNFNVTVMGGGGGGHDASVEYVSSLNSTSSSGSFVANSAFSNFYDLLLVSGGGGGGGSPRDWNNGSAGTGGGGGAGGSVKISNLLLTKGASYSYSVGSGGGSNSGDMHGCCKPNNTDHSRAGNGTESTFKGNVNGSNIEIKIPGGEGGDSIGCSKKKCRGGGAGAGTSSGSITVSGTTGDIARSAGPGGAGGYNYCSRCGSTYLNTVSGGKNSIDTFELDDNNNPVKVSNGSGGDGRGYGSKDVVGESGTGGIIKISQNKKLYGEGGKAGNIESRFVPSIEGYIVASIPAAVESNKRGGDVEAILYKNKTSNGILKKVNGGAAGGTNFIASTNGEDSPWMYSGGGKSPEKCSDVVRMPGSNVKIPTKKFVCKSVKCQLYSYNHTYLKEKNTKSTIDPDTGSAVVKPEYPKGVNDWDNGEDSINSTLYVDTLPLNAAISALTAYLNVLNIFYTTAATATGKIMNDPPDISDDLEPYANKNTYSSAGCYFDSGVLEYVRVCADTTDNYEDGFDTVWKDARNEQTCPAAGNGTIFGAGGGGGLPGDLQGVFGKGGKGAPGAVIIEW